jgi:hypothetical protein
MEEPTKTGEQRRAEIEAWWRLIEGIAWAVLRILGFVGGWLLIISQNFWLDNDPTEVRVLLTIIGAVSTGPATAAGLAQVLQAMRGSHRE